MLVSRGFPLFKSVFNHVTTKGPAINIQQTRSGGFWYRTMEKPDRQHEIMAELAGGILWWWVLWHLWHEYEHIIGHHVQPDGSKWTNEELGIPLDDEN